MTHCTDRKQKVEDELGEKTHGISYDGRSGTKGNFCIEQGSIFKYSKNPYIRTLNFEGQAADGSYLMITISNTRLLGS